MTMHIPGTFGNFASYHHGAKSGSNRAVATKTSASASGAKSSIAEEEREREQTDLRDGAHAAGRAEPREKASPSFRPSGSLC